MKIVRRSTTGAVLTLDAKEVHDLQVLARLIGTGALANMEYDKNVWIDPTTLTWAIHDLKRDLLSIPRKAGCHKRPRVQRGR